VFETNLLVLQFIGKIDRIVRFFLFLIDKLHTNLVDSEPVSHNLLIFIGEKNISFKLELPWR
jgi:hypothetical protein